MQNNSISLLLYQSIIFFCWFVLDDKYYWAYDAMRYKKMIEKKE